MGFTKEEGVYVCDVCWQPVNPTDLAGHDCPGPQEKVEQEYSPQTEAVKISEKWEG